MGQERVGADSAIAVDPTDARDNFPQAGSYQRNVEWSTRTLLDIDATTLVPDSIDPFFFHWTA